MTLDELLDKLVNRGLIAHRKTRAWANEYEVEWGNESLFHVLNWETTWRRDHTGSRVHPEARRQIEEAIFELTNLDWNTATIADLTGHVVQEYP